MEHSPVAGTNGDSTIEPTRRRSGRVVKKPDHLSPSVTASSGKRKRSANDGLGDDDEIDESSSGESGDSGPDNEDITENRRRAKQAKGSNAAAKRSKTDGTATSLPIRGGASKGRSSRKARQDASANAVGGLYGDIFGGQDSLDEVAERWLQQFNDHESNALTEVVNFILQCSGCSIKVNVHDIEDPDNCANRLTDIQEEFQAQSITEYPLIAKGRRATSFKENLSNFFNSLIKTLASSELLYTNPVLLENIQVWVSAMTSAAFPPFRHTATIISLSIISALSEIGRSLTDNRAKTLRQGEGEQKKTKVNKKRVSDMQTAARQAAERGAELDNIIKDWFDTVFVHRYRDKEPKIRVECVTYLSSWIMTYQEQFFDGEHLRYLGWVLSDDNGPTRLETVKQLQTIYRDPSKTVGLRQFTERFRPRMVEMAARDAELNIRCSSIELIDVLRDSGLLEPNDIDSVGRLIYDREARVRKSVAPFFAASVEETVSAKVDELGGEEALAESLPAANDNDFEQPRLEWLKFKSLAELLQSFEPEGEARDNYAFSESLTQLDSSGIDSRTSLATEAFFDKLPVLKQWECLAGCLLYDYSKSSTENATNEDMKRLEEECKLGEREESILLDVLNVSVKEALSDVVSEAGQKKSKKTKAELREVQEEQEAAAQKLMTYIPKLMNKFGASPVAASAVLRLGRVLNLKIFDEFRHDSATFAAFLDDINRQFLTHQDVGVLAAARDALLHATTSEELREIAEGKVHELWEDTIHTLVASCRGDDMTVRGSILEPFLTRVAHSILRISNLATILNCTEVLDTPKQITTNEPRRKRREQPPPVTPIAVLVQAICRGIPSSHVEPEIEAVEDAIAGHAAQSVLFYFMWQHNAIETAIESGKDRSNLNLAILVELAESASTALTNVVSTRRGADTLRVTTAGILLDLHVVLLETEQIIKRSQRDQGTERSLAFRALSSKAQLEILKVFVALEHDYAKKSGRNLEDPADDDEPIDMSDAESTSSEEDEADDGDDEASQRRRERADRKLSAAIIAERALCSLTARIGLAISVGVVDQPVDWDERHTAGDLGGGHIKKRVFRNRTKLGHDFREICNRLERTKETAPSKKSTAKAWAAKTLNHGKKSNEMVVDNDEDDDGELDHAEEDNERLADQDDAENGVALDEERNVDVLPEEAESLLGD